MRLGAGYSGLPTCCFGVLVICSLILFLAAIGSEVEEEEEEELLVEFVDESRVDFWLRNSPLRNTIWSPRGSAVSIPICVDSESNLGLGGSGGGRGHVGVHSGAVERVDVGGVDEVLFLAVWGPGLRGLRGWFGLTVSLGSSWAGGGLEGMRCVRLIFRVHDTELSRG